MPPEGDAVPLDGRVSLGSPVDHAQVVARIRMPDGTWEPISEALTAADGVFRVWVPVAHAHRPLRLTASGANAGYLEAADGGLALLGPTGWLSVDLENAAEHEAAAVHLTAWTTLAACLADAYQQGFGEGAPGGWTEAVLLSRLRIRDHLDGGGVLALESTGPSDLAAGPWPWPSGGTTLGLADTALSVLARQSGSPAGTSAALLGLLCRDLSDAVFDGFESEKDKPSPLAPEEGLPTL
ncbi:MAG: hypothetical protein FJ098_03960, partial [Deltaproteobacteria bacterium]|nr:hypothetical protein [Deltaproteobacteria bacterium]